MIENNHIDETFPDDRFPKKWSPGTFFCLYIAQSLPMSFFSTALQVHMRQEHFSLSQIALLQLIKLPWILKFLWAPSIDKHCQTAFHFKRFILLSEVCYAFLILAVAFLNISTHFYVVLLLVILSFIASATQDIATDAFAALSFSKSEKSVVNSMQSMGNFGGTLLGSGVMLMLLHRWGWNAVIPALSVFALLALLPLLLHRKLPHIHKPPQVGTTYLDIVFFFARRSIWRQIGFLVLYFSAIIGILSVLRPYLVDLGYSMAEIGFISGIVGTASAFCSAFLAGKVIKRIGRYAARVLFACYTLLTTLCFCLLTQVTVTHWMVYAAVCLLWSSYGAASVVVNTTAMDHVRRGREGTDFTLQTVITHLVGIVLAVHCGGIADRLGYTGLFVFETSLALATLLYVIWGFKKETVHE